MKKSPPGLLGPTSDAWLSPSVRDLVESLNRTGEGSRRFAHDILSDKERGVITLSVPADDYADMLGFITQLAEGWRSALYKAEGLKLEAAIANYRRPRGRPRQLKLGSLMGAPATKRPSKKRGRKPKYTADDKTIALAHVLRKKDQLAKERGVSVRRITDKEAIEALNREFPSDTPLPLYKQRKLVAKLCKSISKFRRESGIQLRPRKSRNSANKSV